MDCSTPETWAEIAEWRADGGIPSDVYGALAALGDDLLDATAAGCPPLDTSAMPFTWSGSCETDSGYLLTMEGASWFGGDSTSSEGGYRLVATFEATVFADGSWPTGTLSLEGGDRTSGTGNFGGGSNTLTAAWTFEDPGATGLPLTGTFEAERGESWGGCGGGSARYAGQLDACPFGSAYAYAGHTDAPDVRELHTLTVGGWSGEVRLRECGTREGVGGELRERLDADWAALPFTDADGDACAVEDCDCDDADATIHPGAEDPVGDGLDRDCNGWDDALDDDCPSSVTRCAESAALEDTAIEDTGVPDTGDTDAPDTSAAPAAGSTPEGCGCATPSEPRAVGILGLLAVLAFRRRAPTG